MNLDAWIKKYKNIVVEGPIGVGKTSLTKKIADKYQLTTVLENAGENPFLKKFYTDNEKYALAYSTILFVSKIRSIDRINPG